MSNNAKYTVKFPLELDTTEYPGYDPIGSDNLHELVNFNIKNILLTTPGERTWDSTFGVGLHQLLFEQFEEVELDEIEALIKGQIDTYVPYIYLNQVSFVKSQEEVVFGISLQYTIAQVNTSHVLNIALGDDPSMVKMGEMFGGAIDKGDISKRLIGNIHDWWEQNRYAKPSRKK